MLSTTYKTLKPKPRIFQQLSLHFFKLPALKWLVLFALLFFPIYLTLPDYGITLDEPIYMEAAWKIGDWLSSKPQKIFNKVEIDKYWKTDPYRNVHPSGVKWLYLIAQKAIFWVENPYRQNAIFNVFVFCATMTLFLKWLPSNSFGTSCIYIILLLTIPRFFAHIHFPATDIPMTAFLLLLIVTMNKCLLRSSHLTAGIILGIFVSIKVTSLLLALPIFITYFLWYREGWKLILVRMAMIILTGVFVFYLLNPDYWFSPFTRFKEFITQSTTRETWSPLTVFFNGDFYQYRGPFHYPFTMFFITTPVLYTVFLFAGISCFLINKTLRTNLKMILIFVCFAFPFIILALPVSPAHDGIRYLLPTFPFALYLMTIGLNRIWDFINNNNTFSKYKKLLQFSTAVVLLFTFAMDLNSPARYPPFELSYYNWTIGGVPGAFKKGYETTYWWEIMNDDILKKINSICEGSAVYFPLPPMDYYFKHIADLNKMKFHPEYDLKKADYMLIIGRPFVSFWENKKWPEFKQNNKVPVPVYELSLDSIPVLKLYLIKNRILFRNK